MAGGQCPGGSGISTVLHLALGRKLTQEQAETLATVFRSRCPVYRTLERSNPIELETIISPPLNTQRRMKTLLCHGTRFECDHEAPAESDADILQLAANHTKDIHGINVAPEMAAKVMGLIRDEEE